ncbi:hypothetical protein [Flavobacterium sp.]|uniref:hypothetical protein n=1 Tax=Flavobacterium sp. TaxID=239 RepID=UPI0035AE36A8
MRKFILFLIIPMFLACKNKEDKFLNIIKENNEILKNQLDTDIYVLKQKSLEAKGIFVEKYDNLSKTYNQIIKVKSKNDYELVEKRISNYALKNKIKFDFKKIDSENTDVLQNNLLLNFARFCNYIKIFQTAVNSSNCGLMGSNYIYTHKFIKNDSLNIDFESRANFNNCNLVIDSIVDEYSKINKFKSNSFNKFWNVKFKPKSNNVKIYWKVYLHDDLAGTILFEKGVDTITKINKK